jgi:hypothetical protein
MSRRLRVLLTVAVLCPLTVLSCDSGTESTEWPSVYRFAGTITSAQTHEPISGAQFAVLWSAGAFGDGGDGTVTDEQGQYYFERDFEGRTDCERLAIAASAAGYEEVDLGLGHVRCTSNVQTFDFELVPLP